MIGVHAFLVLAMVVLQIHALIPMRPTPLHGRIIEPKTVIISMWTPEAQVWLQRFPESGLGNLSSIAVSTPGLSMLYPLVYCTEDGSVCQITIGEGEINAAASTMAFVLSRKFDLRQTYFIVSGIAGVNPKHATLGSVALARYATQVALQYELDARSVPSDWPTGYISYGRDRPLEYPLVSYGTEVFEVNADLLDMAYDMASNATLSDSKAAQKYRSKYAAVNEVYKMAAQPPSLVKCDGATSDTYFSGHRLSEAFENTTSIWTNGSATYCTSAQEENATLEVMVRAAIEGLVDFGRIIVMRSGSNFDRPPPAVSDLAHLTDASQNAFYISLDNLFNVGIEVVRGILADWNCTFSEGVPASNYIGDIFGSLGGEPDFGYGSITGGQPVAPADGSGVMSSNFMRRRKLPLREDNDET